MNTTRALVVFGDAFPQPLLARTRFTAVIGAQAHRAAVEASGARFLNIAELTKPGSVHEASAFVERLSLLRLKDGSRLTQLFTYRGFPLWWTRYSDLIRFYGIPYTQYQPLLEALSPFTEVHLVAPPCPGLFTLYAKAHRKRLVMRAPRTGGFPAGLVLQVILTCICLPVLMVLGRPYLIFTSDKFSPEGAYDYRSAFIYKELRHRRLPYVECIRTLESFRTTFLHFFSRRRPVVYYEGIAALGRLLGTVSGGRARALRRIERMTPEGTPDARFEYFVATNFLGTAYGDQLAIRLMRMVLRSIGVRSAFIPAASERNFFAVIACKLLDIPTVGIMHGVSTPHSTAYDFMPGYDGARKLSVDRYGVWSAWWKSYFLKRGDAYEEAQLVVSGPMRPLTKKFPPRVTHLGPVRVLFIAEQRADPAEVLRYLTRVLADPDLVCTIKFRPYRDAFEEWLKENAPELLAQVQSVKGSVEDALAQADVVVGTYSTAVLEALLAERVPLFCRTHRWGDYYDLQEEHEALFAEDPEELIAKIKRASAVSHDEIRKLRERYFGDPYQNGSAWVVETLVEQNTRAC